MASHSSTSSALLTLATTALGSTVPARRFVSHNAPAWDCDDCDGQLTVHMTPGRFRQTAGRPGSQSVPASTWHVQLVRRVPADATPTPAALSASALGLQDDYDRLQTYLREHVADVFEDAVATLGVVTALGPQGGFGGWDLAIEADVNVAYATVAP